MNIRINARVYFVLFVFLLYIIAFFPLYNVTRESIIAFSALPVMMAAWFWGSRVGMLVGFLNLPLNILLLYLVLLNRFSVMNIREVLTISLAVIVIGLVVGLLRDLSNRLQTANKYLAELDQTKDEFLSIVTHDLKTPLVSLLDYNQLLLSGMDGEINEKQRSHLEIIKQQTKILQNMIDSILDYTRVRFGKLKVDLDTVSINSLVIEALAEVKAQADEKKIPLDFHSPDEIFLTKCDKKMM